MDRAVGLPPDSHLASRASCASLNEFPLASFGSLALERAVSLLALIDSTSLTQAPGPCWALTLSQTDLAVSELTFEPWSWLKAASSVGSNPVTGLTKQPDSAHTLTASPTSIAIGLRGLFGFFMGFLPGTGKSRGLLFRMEVISL
ncbi:MAG: hypothetical protein WCI47_02915 [bacterium]